MLCERCKMREANIRYTEVINGVRTEHNLCSQCAQEMELGPYAAMFDGEFSLGKLLSGILGMGAQETEEEDDQMEQVVCPACGTSYGEFLRDSTFGCADCYETFDPLIGEKIKKLQGSERHTGKTPKFCGSAPVGREEVQQDLTAEAQLAFLDSKLKEAIREEEYELAAQYRDQIKALRERNEEDE